MDSIWIFIWTWTFLLVSTRVSGKVRGEFYRVSQDEDFEEGFSTAHLLVDKRVLNKHLVESLDIIVQFQIYNVGFQTATDVHFRDQSFDDHSQFLIVGGLTDAHFGRILGGTNITHVVVVRPLQSGPISLQPAQITYHSGDNTFHGSSSGPEKIVVYSATEYHRKFSTHFEQWIAFGILSLPSLLIPYMLWFTSKSKYENLIKESEPGVSRKRRMYYYQDR